MIAQTMLITVILIILSSPAIEVKPVIIGFKENLDSTSIPAL